MPVSKWEATKAKKIEMQVRESVCCMVPRMLYPLQKSDNMPDGEEHAVAGALGASIG
jgi:hypothetical protein